MTGKFGLKFKLAVIAVAGILSLPAGKAFANCDLIVEYSGQKSKKLANVDLISTTPPNKSRESNFFSSQLATP